MRRMVGKVALCLVVLAAAGVAPQSDATATVRPDGKDVARGPATARAAELLGRLPASFDANDGQFDERVRLAAQAGGVAAWFVDGETVLRLGGDDPGLPETLGRPRRATRCDGVLRMKFPSSSSPRGEARLPSHSNWFLSNDPARWRTGVASFGRARYEDAAPGVDVVWRGTRRALAYDVVVAPGADPSAFSIEFEGARSLIVDPASGDLVVTTPSGGELRHSRPRCWQSAGGAQRDVAGRFVVDGARVSFAVGAWDRSRELVIDPTLEYSTYLGGNNTDVSLSGAVTPAGDLCLSGQTYSMNFPLAAPVQSYAGQSDMFVAKIRANGTGLIFSTYIGGLANDYGEAVAADSSGNVYVVGVTTSNNMPVVSAYQPSIGGVNDAFVVKLLSAGGQISYATYLGGSQDDFGYGIGVDGNGSAYVTGYTSSTNFPLAAPRQGTYGGGGSDVFVTKVAPSGSSLVWSTFHGGNGTDLAYYCHAEAGGSLVLGGYTTSTNLPVNNAFQGALAASGTDGFVARFNATGSALVFGTYLGGSGTDIVNDVTVDGAGTVYACGQTSSTNFPTAAPAQATYGGGTFDAFVTMFQLSGNALAFSTYLGGTAEDVALGVVADPSGGFAVTGYTASSNFPSMKSFQGGYGGGISDGFAVRYSQGTPAMVYATLVGGSGEDRLYGADIDANGRLCSAGLSTSTNFPVQAAFQPGYAGNLADAVFVRIAPSVATAPGGLNAVLVGTASARLTWSDLSGDETGFEIQRRLNNGAFTAYVSVPAGTVVYDDTSIFPAQTYTYRVRALGAEGPSAPSNEASVVVPAGAGAVPPPKAPDNLEALVVSATEVELSWRDRSNDEQLFEVQRAVGGTGYESIGTAPQDTVRLTDTVAPPGWPLNYRVRALSVQGPSPFGTAASATTPATLTLATTSGLVTDSAKPGRDKLNWKGTFAFPAAAEPIDPRTLVVRVQAGPALAPVAAAIPAQAAWKVKRKKYTWKSAKGVSPKISVTLDAAKGTFSVKASAFDYVVAPGTGQRLLLSLGPDGGAIAQTWVPQRAAGTFAAPKP